MLRVASFCLCILLLPFIVRAQKEVNIWYFGYHAGLNFNTTPTTVLTDGQTDTREGVATICDGATGKLLFYTEGSTVWNAKHEVMPNGTGLMGDPTSVQSGIAVPFPGHPGQYYLFTTMTDKGFRYNVVDLALDNGKGDIVPGTKNTILLDTWQSTEKMAATRHCNGRDYWVVTHSTQSNTFYVYLLSPSGLSAPTTYSVGAPIRSGGWEEAGHIKFSPDGSIILHSLCSISQGAMSVVDLLKFDNQTGVISAPFASLDIIFPLGVEFTTSGRLLYVVSMNLGQWNKLYQYDMTAPDIGASQQTIVTSTDDIQMGGLQMGPDGHIYMGFEKGYFQGYRYVGMIHKPDVRGIGCNFERDAVDMDPTGNRRTSVSFPTFMSSFLNVPGDFTASEVCGGSPVFRLVSESGVKGVLWDFGDGSTSTALSPRHTYASDKTYSVKVRVVRECSTDEKTKEITTGHDIATSVTKTICSNEPYILPDGRKVNTAGIYTSTIKRFAGPCDSVITTTLNVLPAYQFTEKIRICSGDVYQLPDGRKVNSSGSYTSSLKTYQHCDSIITTELFVPARDYPVAASICQGDSYQLPDGKTITDAGVYRSVFTSSLGCDSVIVTTLTVNPAYRIVQPVNICEGDHYRLPDGLVVNVTGQYISYLTTYLGCDSTIVTDLRTNPHYHLSKDASTCDNEPYLLPDGRKVSLAGTYISSLTSCYGCDSVITTRLTVLPSYSWELYDTICNGNLYTLPDGRKVERANDYTSRLFTVAGCDSIIVVHLALKEKPKVLLDPETCLFAGRPATITLTPGYDRYEWQSGFTGNVYNIRYPGTYRVAVTNECGTTMVQTIAKECSVDLYVPNAFTPNDDGQNDLFRLRQPHGQVLLEFRVFDRWGMEVFATTDAMQGWDGTFKGHPQAVGAYVYFIRYKNIDGIERHLRGSVTLLR